jgi:hypothetical protein
MSDSKAALRAVRATAFNSKLVAERLDARKRLTIKCKLTVVWVSGHTGIAGNEITKPIKAQRFDSLNRNLSSVTITLNTNRAKRTDWQK